MQPKTITTPPAVGTNKNATSFIKDALFEIGHLCSVHIHYLSCPSTTRVQVFTSNGEEPCIPEEKILDVIGNSDGWYYPRVQAHATDGKKIGSYTKVNIYGNIKVQVTTANPGSVVHVIMMIE